MPRSGVETLLKQILRIEISLGSTQLGVVFRSIPIQQRLLCLADRNPAFHLNFLWNGPRAITVQGECGPVQWRAPVSTTVDHFQLRVSQRISR